MKTIATAGLLAAASFVLVPLRPAVACSPPGAWLHRTAQPAEGAIGVPTNAEVRVSYIGCLDELGNAQVQPALETAAGEAVAVTVEKVEDSLVFGRLSFVLRPTAPLTPETEYRVVDGLDLGDEGDLQCFELAQAGSGTAPPLNTFTTGAGPDTSPPTFAGATGAVVSDDACDDSACCGPYFVQRGQLSYAPATDDVLPVELRYHVYAQGQDQPLVRYTQAPVGIACGSDPLSPWDGFTVPPGATAALYLRAVDLAGNVAGPTTPVSVAIDCDPDPIAEPGPEPTVEPGPEATAEPGPVAEDQPDAGSTPDVGAEADTAPDAGPPSDAKGSGCGAASSGPLAGLLALLALAASRRRTRSARSPSAP